MDITILIERSGIRAYTTVKSEATRIVGVHKIRWMGARANNHQDYYSLTHVATGRALNRVPLTADEADRLVDALIECPIEWEKISDDRRAQYPGVPWYTDRLTTEATRLAGRY